MNYKLNSNMSDCFVPFRFCCMDLPRDILRWVWILEMKMRFLAGLKARRRAATVIQEAWFLHAHGPLPGLVDSNVWLDPINPWMILAVLGNVEIHHNMDEIDEILAVNGDVDLLQDIEEVD